MDEKYKFMGSKAGELEYLHGIALQFADIFIDENTAPVEAFDKGFNSAMAVIKILLEEYPQ